MNRLMYVYGMCPLNIDIKPWNNSDKANICTDLQNVNSDNVLNVQIFYSTSKNQNFS